MEDRAKAERKTSPNLNPGLLTEKECLELVNTMTEVKRVIQELRKNCEGLAEALEFCLPFAKLHSSNFEKIDEAIKALAGYNLRNLD